MTTFADACRAADYLGAKRELETAPLAGFLALASAAALSLLFPREDSPRWFAALLGGLMILPLLLRPLLRKGAFLPKHLLSLAAYPLNGLLLGLVLYRELWKADVLGLDELVPNQDYVLFSLVVLAPAAYYMLNYPAWKRRLLGLGRVLALLREPPPEAALREVAERLERLKGRAAAPGCAEFRTRPASPRDWRRFLKPDTERHGLWRAHLGEDWGLVAFADGSEPEAVPRKGIRMAADDEGGEGRLILCLVRWNAHLKEGRITPEYLGRIRAWE